MCNSPGQQRDITVRAYAIKTAHKPLPLYDAATLVMHCLFLFVVVFFKC